MGRNGTIARYETRNDTSSSTALARIADTYIKFKGKPEISLTITTHNNDIFNIGQQVYFDAPINELKSTYMVKSKDIQITKTGTSGQVFYTYVLNNNFTSENAINFFDNQRRKRKGNIGEDEYITRNIDINNEMNIIFDNLSKDYIDSDKSTLYSSSKIENKLFIEELKDYNESLSYDKQTGESKRIVIR